METASFPPFTDFPPTFCQDTLSQIICAAKIGKNVQLVGPIGSGKSLILRSLAASPQIIKYHVSNYSHFKFIYIDLNLIPRKDSTSIISFLQPNFHIHSDQQTILIFDSFIELCSPDLMDLHNWLYSQFNIHRHQLSYIFALDLPIIDPVKLAVFHDLDQLLLEKIVYLQPLNRLDATWFIDRNLEHLGKNLSDSQKSEIITLSGGYMQTLKRLVETNTNYQDDIHLNYQLEKLYRCLKPILTDSPLLLKMGLLNEAGQFTNLLLADLIQKKSLVTPTDPIDTLTAAEIKAYNYLKSRQDEVVTRIDLITAIWGSSLHPEASDHALDQLIHRLKLKLQKSSPPQTVSTIRGRGHRLSN